MTQKDESYSDEAGRREDFVFSSPILYDIVLQCTSKFSVKISTVRSKYILFIILRSSNISNKELDQAGMRQLVHLTTHILIMQWLIVYLLPNETSALIV